MPRTEQGEWSFEDREGCIASAHQVCMFGTAKDYCGQPATTHVWTSEDEFTMCCDTHKPWWETHSWYDRHPIGGCCGLPDTKWKYAENGADSFCYVEGLPGDPALAVAVEELTSEKGASQ